MQAAATSSLRRNIQPGRPPPAESKVNTNTPSQSLRHVAEVGAACAAHAVELGFIGVAAKILQATQKLLAETTPAQPPTASA
jgi:hypothetical protein